MPYYVGRDSYVYEGRCSDCLTDWLAHINAQTKTTGRSTKFGELIAFVTKASLKKRLLKISSPPPGGTNKKRFQRVLAQSKFTHNGETPGRSSVKSKKKIFSTILNNFILRRKRGRNHDYFKQCEKAIIFLLVRKSIQLLNKLKFGKYILLYNLWRYFA